MAAKKVPSLRGSALVTVDDQGRLKIPTAFKEILVTGFGYDFFITSLTGENVWVYPLMVWEAHEERLKKAPSTNPSLKKYLDRVNYFGMEVTMDKQGRILIPATLRNSAAIDSELRVLGQSDHLEVWNEVRFGKRMTEQQITDTDLLALSELGI